MLFQLFFLLVPKDSVPKADFGIADSLMLLGMSGFMGGSIAVLKQDVVYRRYGNFFFRM